MAVVGSLDIRLRAKAREFLGNMKKARLATRAFSAVTRTLSKNMLGLSISFAGATTALGLLVKRGASAVDSLAKMSQKLGIATEDMAAFEFAGRLVNVRLPQIEMGLQRMLRRADEASRGVGEARDAFKALGITQQELISLDPAALFFRLADAMQQLGSRRRQIGQFFKIVDSEGINMIRIADLGSEKFAELREEAIRLGFAFDPMGAAAVQEMQDALTRLGVTMDGIGRQMAIEFGPEIERLIGVAEEGIPPGKTFTQGVKKWLVWLTRIADSTNIYRRIVDEFQRAVGGPHIEGLRIFDDTLGDFIERMEDIDLPPIDTEKSKQFVDDMQAAAEAAEQMKREAEELQLLQRFSERLIDRIKTPQEKITEEIENAGEALQKGLITFEQWSKFIDDANRRLTEADFAGVFRRAGDELEDTIDDVTDAVKDLSDAFQADIGRPAALELGTAAAFSQATRSFSDVQRINTAILGESRRQTAHLANIEEGIDNISGEDFVTLSLN